MTDIFKKKSLDNKIQTLLDNFKKTSESYKKELNNILSSYNNSLNDEELYCEEEIDEDLKEKLLNVFTGYIVCCGKGYILKSSNEEIIIDDEIHVIDLVFYNNIFNVNLLVKFINHPIDDESRKNMFDYINYYNDEIKDSEDNFTLGMIIYSGINDASIAYLCNDNINNKYLFDKDELLDILKNIHDFDTDDIEKRNG